LHWVKAELLRRWLVEFPTAANPVVLAAARPATLEVVQRELRQGWRMAMSTALGTANMKRML
jgi:hypothetical protein